jgi:hypothetical protein
MMTTMATDGTDRVAATTAQTAGPGLHGDDAGDLAGVDLAEGAAKPPDLCEHGDLPAVDAPDPGDDPVTRERLTLHAERVRAVARPAAEFSE